MGDEGFSSDDLLKQAKDKLGIDEDGTTPAVPTYDSDEPEPAEMAAPDAASEISEALVEAADWLDLSEPEVVKSASEIAAEMREKQASKPAPKAVSRPSDFINSTSPPTQARRSGSLPPLTGPPPVPAPPAEPAASPQEPGPSQFPTPQMPPLPSEPEPERGRRFGIGTLVRIGIVGIIGFTLVAGFLDSSTPVQDVGVGDCIETIDVEATQISSLETVACTEPHQFEVYAVPRYDLAAYADDQVMFEIADQMCYDRFAGYVGVAFEESTLWYDYLIPTEESWNQDDRSVTCLLFALDAGNNIFPVSSSFRNSGR